MENVKCVFSERKEKEIVEDGLFGFFLAPVDTKLGLSFRWPDTKWIHSRGTL